MMKKSFCGLPLLILTCICTIIGATPAWAGEINSHEARLFSAASGTFNYEGKTYRASEQYVEELRTYLCEDDVDLTAEDVDSLISDMYANVPAGIQDGYLEEYEEASDRVTVIDESDMTETETDDEPADEAAEEAVSDDEPEQTPYIVEETPQETQIVDAEGSVIFSAAPMIKTVGYHKQTARAFFVIGTLMLTAIFGGTMLVIRHEKA